MKVTLKTILALTLCLATALFFGVFASAEGLEDGGAATGSVRYTLATDENGEYFGIVDSFEGDIPADGVLVIPDVFVEEGFDDLPLLEVKADCFIYDEFDSVASKYIAVKEIVISEGIKAIGDNAFMGMPNLEKVTVLGDTVIGKNVFADCKSLQSVVFAGDTVTVGEGAFSGCTLLSSVLDNYIKYASPVDFTVGFNAFNDTAWYKNYQIDFVTLGTTLVGYRGTDSVVTIPLNITKIADGAFANNSFVKKIIFSKNVWYIGEKAFYNASSLADVEFSRYGEITFVGADAFTGTPYFNNYEGDFFTVGTILIKYLGDDVYVSIPNTVTVISPNAFLGCFKSSSAGTPGYTISAIKVPASVLSFGDNCFASHIMEDESFYYPQLYVFDGTAAEQYLEGKYVYTVLSIPGDVNGDGVITAEDARLALRIAVKIDIDAAPEVKFITDVDGDGKVTSEDARIILRLAVKLEKYTAEDLMYKPGTVFEILQAYTNSLKNVVKYNAGYTKTVSKVLNSFDLNPNTKTYLCDFKDLDIGVTTVTYLADSKEALEAVEMCTMLSTDSIKSASCVLNDGKYTITITFNDFEDIDGTTPLTKVMPLTSRTYYDNFLAKQTFFKWKYNSFTYDLFYRNAKVVAVMDADSMKLESLEMYCEYDFANIDGKIYGIPVDGTICGGSDVGSALRTDTIKYENFIF